MPGVTPLLIRPGIGGDDSLAGGLPNSGPTRADLHHVTGRPHEACDRARPKLVRRTKERRSPEPSQGAPPRRGPSRVRRVPRATGTRVTTVAGPDPVAGLQKRGVGYRSRCWSKLPKPDGTDRTGPVAATLVADAPARPAPTPRGEEQRVSSTVAVTVVTSDQAAVLADHVFLSPDEERMLGLHPIAVRDLDTGAWHTWCVHCGASSRSAGACPRRPSSPGDGPA
jgi:hypothetical protein